MLYHYTVVIKEWCDVARDFLCRTTLSRRHIIGMREKTHQCKQCITKRLFNVIHSCYVSRIHGHILISKVIVSKFSSTVRSTFHKIKRCRTIVQWSNSNVKLVKERQQITWRHAQNVVSLRVLSKFINFNSTFATCLKFVLIKFEMLDKLITFIVCWYKTIYQILPVVWTNHITTGSTWCKVLYQHTLYVMGIYHGLLLSAWQYTEHVETVLQSDNVCDSKF
jgi:hypothetical protein